MYHCRKMSKYSTASNASGSRWLVSLEEEMESSMAPGDHQKLKIDRPNWKYRKCCIYMATPSPYQYSLFFKSNSNNNTVWYILIYIIDRAIDRFVVMSTTWSSMMIPDIILIIIITFFCQKQQTSNHTMMKWIIPS